MTRSLSPHPDLDQIKRQAKEIRGAHDARDQSVCPVLRRLRRFTDASDSDILQSPLSLHEAQYALAMDYGFTSWHALKQHVLTTTQAGVPDPVSELSIGLVSCRVVQGEKETNLRAMEDVLRAQAGLGVRLFVFPEMNISGFPRSYGADDCAEYAEPVPDGPSTARVMALAREYRTVLCTGLVERDEGRFYYTHILCGPDGFIGKQRKIFPARGLMSVDAVSGGGNPCAHDLFGRQCVILAGADWMLPEAIHLAGMSEAALIICPTDEMSVPNLDVMRSIALARTMDTRASLAAVFGGSVPREGEVMAGLAVAPSSPTGDLLLCETRLVDEVKVMKVDLPLSPPEHRWGDFHARSQSLLNQAHDQVSGVGCQKSGGAV